MLCLLPSRLRLIVTLRLDYAVAPDVDGMHDDEAAYEVDRNNGLVKQRDVCPVAQSPGCEIDLSSIPEDPFRLYTQGFADAAKYEARLT